jgi:CubicO group peptidase (beta-lactamase class C family)
LGPLRIAPKEGAGWLFAAGELAMPAEDLAKWDVSLINQTLLKPASYRELETTVLLKNGVATNYGLGLGVHREFSRRILEHGGEVSGFTSANIVFPDDHAAVVVLTNEDAVDVSDQIANKIVPLLFPQEDSGKDEAQARAIFEDLQNGRVNRTLFSDNANAYLSETALKDFASGLGPLGAPQSFIQGRRSERGGMTFRLFTAKFLKQSLQIWQRTLPDGKIEQYQVMVTE